MKKHYCDTWQRTGNSVGDACRYYSLGVNFLLNIFVHILTILGL